MELTSAKRRSFLQRLVCLLGGAAGASAIESKAESPIAAKTSGNSSLKFLMNCRHVHGAWQSAGRLVCRGELTETRDGNAVGEFFSNCFCAESSFGFTNPFAASNIELHTVRFQEGTLFGMGANNSKTASERVHAILGGTGRFAGARGTYVIAENPDGASELTISLLA